MAYIKRTREKDLKKILFLSTEHKNVILVEGARQVGKSCLVEEALKGIDSPKIELNLEVDAVARSRIDRCREFSEFHELMEDEFGFEGASKGVVFIDEAQESLMLGRFVRSMKEKWPYTTVILTGSSLTRLFRKDVRYPVGRVTRVVVRPLSFSEFLYGMGQEKLSQVLTSMEFRISPARHERLLELYDVYLETGGLPEVVLAARDALDFHSLQRSLLASYEQDFIRLFGEEWLHVAQGCLASVANHVGFPSKLSSVLGQTSDKVLSQIKNLFSRLENWHLVFRSSQYGSSVTASHDYLPKRYLFDTGLLRKHRETAVPPIRLLHTLDNPSRTPLGSILENQVACDLAGMGFELSGWKKSPSGMEIDFVLKREDSTVPVECKAALSVNKRHLKGILEYLRLHDQPRGILVSFAPFQKIEVSGKIVYNVPAYWTTALDSLEPFHVS